MNRRDGVENGSMMGGQNRCGLGCGWGCGAWRGAEHPGEFGEAGADETRQPLTSSAADSSVAGPNGPAIGSPRLQGWGFVLATSYTLLLPPLVLLVSALLWTDSLGEGGVVTAGLGISLLLLLPAHRWLTHNAAMPPCSRRGT